MSNEKIIWNRLISAGRIPAGYAQEFYDKFAKTGGNALKLLTCMLTENKCKLD